MSEKAARSNPLSQLRLYWDETVPTWLDEPIIRNRPARPEPISAATKSQVRRVAVLLSLYFWVAYTGVGLCFGKSFPQAISAATATAIGGLIGWTIYSLISRRADGLILLAMGLGPVMARQSQPFWFMLAFSVVWNMVAAGMGVLIVRLFAAKGHPPKPIHPLYDTAVDERIR